MENKHAPGVPAPRGRQTRQDGSRTVLNQSPTGRNFPFPFQMFMLLFALNSMGAEMECRTFERFRADFVAAMELSDGTCPVFGRPDMPDVRNSFIPTGATPVKTVRLRFHIFANTDGSTPTSTPARTDQMVSELNNYYRPWKLQFVHTTRQVNDSRYRSLADSEEYAMKDAYCEAPEAQHNVFVVNVESPYNGWGTFPWMGEALTRQGGTVIDESAFLSGTTTLPHELGHGLGLWHTHHGVSEVDGCTSCYERPGASDRDMTGDFCSDTPPTPRSWDCRNAVGVDTCSSRAWGTTDYQNLMSYSSCRNHFTSQQAGRMHAWIEEKLGGWLNVPPTRTIYVDLNYAGANPNGSPSAPFPTVQHGFNAAQNGDVLKVRSGNYGVSSLLGGKAVRIETENGLVRLSLTPQAPTPTLIANAGPDADIATASSASLRGAAQSINTDPATTWHWEKLSGPGRIFSQNYNIEKLDFWVSSSGTYELKLTVSNGKLISTDQVRVTFREPVLYIDAGNNQASPFPWTASLAGSILVDEKPNPDATFRWRQVSGPGALTFTSPTSLGTGVVPSKAGVYYVYLEAWYRGKYKADRVTLAFGMPLPCCSVGDENEEAPVLDPLLEVLPDPSGSMRLTVLSPDARPCVIQRSENLRDWTDWKFVNPVNGTLSLLDSEAPSRSRQFYGLRMQ